MKKNINIIVEKFLKEQESIEGNINDNFWKWFGASKVKKGSKPLVLYHGTKTNFDVFKPSKSIGNQGETD